MSCWPKESSIGFDLAFVTQSGWLVGTSQLKNSIAATTRSTPRAAPEKEAQRAVQRADRGCR